MPVIIDTNCFPNVFVRTSEKHKDFEPVLLWILTGKGQLVYGGSKYKRELVAAKKFLTIFRLLKAAGKVTLGNDEHIDKIEKEVIAMKDSDDFDDEHLVAICRDTRCRVICSEDMRSVKYVTDKKYYPTGFNKPVYYSSLHNVDLLCDKYVDPILKPLCKINKSLAESLFKNLPQKDK